MRQATIKKASNNSFERSYIKSYVKLLTQQAVTAAKKIDAYFFGPNGEDAELRTWYYGATAFYLTVGIFLFFALN